MNGQQLVSSNNCRSKTKTASVVSTRGSIGIEINEEGDYHHNVEIK